MPAMPLPASPPTRLPLALRLPVTNRSYPIGNRLRPAAPPPILSRILVGAVRRPLNTNDVRQSFAAPQPPQGMALAISHAPGIDHVQRRRRRAPAARVASLLPHPPRIHVITSARGMLRTTSPPIDCLLIECRDNDYDANAIPRSAVGLAQALARIPKGLPAQAAICPAPRAALSDKSACERTDSTSPVPNLLAVFAGLHRPAV